MNKYSEYLARFTSYVFHPLFMPTNGMILVFYLGKIPGFNLYSTDSDKTVALFTISILFLATCIAPLLIALALKKLKIISSLKMPNREERSIPFLLTCFCYFGAYYYLRYEQELPLNGLIFYFIFFGMFATLLGFVVTLFWKISIHMIGIGGITGILSFLSKFNQDVLLYPLSVSFLIAGLIGFSRLRLKAHNAKQLIAGFCLGFCCELFGIFYLFN